MTGNVDYSILGDQMGHTGASMSGPKTERQGPSNKVTGMSRVITLEQSGSGIWRQRNCSVPTKLLG
jgi:hypothetical protein